MRLSWRPTPQRGGREKAAADARWGAGAQPVSASSHRALASASGSADRLRARAPVGVCVARKRGSDIARHLRLVTEGDGILRPRQAAAMLMGCPPSATAMSAQQKQRALYRATFTFISTR